MQLWDLLPQLSDLSAATGSVMSLLAHLYGGAAAAAANPAALGSAVAPTAGSEELSFLVPRLWPFIRHTLSTVRASVMHCLERMLAAAVRTSAAFAAAAAAAGAAAPSAAAAPESELTGLVLPPPWVQQLLSPLLQLVFQNVLVEGEGRVLDASVRVWRLLVRCAAPVMLREGLAPELLRGMMALAATPVRGVALGSLHGRGGSNVARATLG